MFVLESTLKVFCNGVKHRVEKGETLEEVLNSFYGLKENEKEQIKEALCGLL